MYAVIAPQVARLKSLWQYLAVAFFRARY